MRRRGHARADGLALFQKARRTSRGHWPRRARARHFVQLLDGEGQPAFQLPRSSLVSAPDRPAHAAASSDGAIMQRAPRRRLRGRGSNRSIGVGRGRCARYCGRRPGPATGCDLSGSAPADGVQLLRRAHQIDMHARRPGSASAGFQIVAHGAEIGGQHDLEPGTLQGDVRIGLAQAHCALPRPDRAPGHGSSICTHSAPRLRQRRENLAHRPAAAVGSSDSGSKPDRASWPSFRNVTGPSSTGRVWMPRNFASSIFVERLAARRAENCVLAKVPARCSDNWCRTIWSFLRRRAVPVMGVTAIARAVPAPARHGEIESRARTGPPSSRNDRAPRPPWRWCPASGRKARNRWRE